MEHLRLHTNWLPLTRPARASLHADVPVAGGFVKVGFTVRPALQAERRMLNPNLMLFWNTLGEGEAEVWEAMRRVKAMGRPLAGAEAALAPLLRKPHVVARLAWQRVRRSPWCRQLALCANHEQSLNPRSRVTLSGERDRLGLRKLKIDWGLQDVDWHSIAEFQAVVRNAFAGSGLSESIEFRGPDEHRPFDDSSHAMGTTLMSDDPRKGVVDADCRVHSVPNLYVCGSSVFPRGGNANPTLTIVALAMRLAEHLAGQLE
jgi:choline dehydrogenase-like flavoprotein